MTSDDKPRRAGASAERVAELLRRRIISGDLSPGSPLREVAAATEFQVARTTLREAFRLLAADGLVDVTLYRGAFVRTLSVADVRDIYVVRRVLEVKAAEESVVADQSALDAVSTEHDKVQRAFAANAWHDVGTTSLGFHEAIVALLGSPQLSRFFHNVVAQLRLAFAYITDDEAFHRPWAPRDRAICAMLHSGQRNEAAAELRTYLDESERAVLDHMRATGLLDPSRKRTSRAVREPLPRKS